MPATAFSALSKALLVLAVVIGSCGRLSDADKQAVKDALSDSLAYLSESWDIDVNLIEGGLRKVRIRAPYGTSQETANGIVMSLSGPVNILVRDSLGNMEVEIRSDSARYITRDGQFIFDGNVFAFTHDNRRLTAETLTWFQKTGDITSSGFVRIVTPTDSIQGYGLVGRADLSEYVLENLSGSIQINTNDE
jgi:LPS export ABC transporter protein LptC